VAHDSLDVQVIHIERVKVCCESSAESMPTAPGNVCFLECWPNNSIRKIVKIERSAQLRPFKDETVACEIISMRLKMPCQQRQNRYSALAGFRLSSLLDGGRAPRGALDVNLAVLQVIPS
jgi:hypothetical protein